MTKDQITNKIGLLSYQYNIPALSKEERATFPFNLTQVSSGGVRNPGRFLVGWPSQAHTMEMIPYWMTSFSPTKKKKKRILLSLGERVMDTKVLVLPLWQTKKYGALLVIFPCCGPRAQRTRVVLSSTKHVIGWNYVMTKSNGYLMARLIHLWLTMTDFTVIMTPKE